MVEIGVQSAYYWKHWVRPYSYGQRVDSEGLVIKIFNSGEKKNNCSG